MNFKQRLSQRLSLCESITFSFNHRRASQCDKCGKKYDPKNWMSVDQDNIKCIICNDMGLVDDPLELNVANANAWVIFDMLNITHDSYGEISPAELLTKLNQVWNPSAFTRKTKDNLGIEMDMDGIRPTSRVIDVGLGEDRISFYVSKLKEIAEAALEAGEMITWG